MPERPQVTAAKTQRIAEILADEREIRGMSKADRPGQASTSEVRAASASALREVADAGSSVSDAEAVALPSDRLGGGS